MRIVSLLVLASWIVFCSTAAATVFGDDPRKQVSTQDDPRLMRIGRTFQGEDGGGATVWMAGECEVMMTYHTAFFRGRDQATGRVLTHRGKVGTKIEVHLGLMRGSPDKAENFKYHLTGEIADFGNYASNDTTGTFQDWAVIRLPPKDCIGREIGFFDVKMTAKRYEPPTGELMLVGFHQDRRLQDGVSVEVGCRAVGDSAGVGGYSTDCSMMPMCSGCPVLETQPNGEMLVVGMMVAGSLARPIRFIPELANWMVMADVFSEDLLKVRGIAMPQDLARKRGQR